MQTGIDPRLEIIKRVLDFSVPINQTHFDLCKIIVKL